MRKHQVHSLFTFVLMFCITNAYSQVSVDSITREVSAEAAYFNEYHQQFGNVIEVRSSTEMDDLNEVTEVTLGSASCFGSQVTTVVGNDNLMLISGDLGCGYLQPDAGVRQFFRAWSSVVAWFSVDSLSNYRIVGHLSGNARAELIISDSLNGETSYVSLTPGEFEYTAELSGPGPYRFDLSVATIVATDSGGGEQATLGFSFEVVPVAVVPTENDSWGGLKSLYR